jgi:hypothetical protein
MGPSRWLRKKLLRLVSSISDVLFAGDELVPAVVVPGRAQRTGLSRLMGLAGSILGNVAAPGKMWREEYAFSQNQLFTLKPRAVAPILEGSRLLF